MSDMELSDRVRDLEAENEALKSNLRMVRIGCASQIYLLKPGEVTDKLVAHALGWIVPGTTPEQWRDEFKPTTDWNAAMAAAAESGLFLTHMIKESPELVDRWSVFFVPDDEKSANRFIHITSDSSGPMVISKAILLANLSSTATANLNSTIEHPTSNIQYPKSGKVKAESG